MVVTKRRLVAEWWASESRISVGDVSGCCVLAAVRNMNYTNRAQRVISVISTICAW